MILSYIIFFFSHFSYSISFTATQVSSVSVIGPLSIRMYNNFIYSATRTGAINVYRFEPFAGTMTFLVGTQVGLITDRSPQIELFYHPSIQSLFMVYGDIYTLAVYQINEQNSLNGIVPNAVFYEQLYVSGKYSTVRRYNITDPFNIKMISSVDPTSFSSITPWGSASMALDGQGFLYIASRLSMATSYGLLKIAVQSYQLVPVANMLRNTIIRTTYSKGNTNCLFVGDSGSQDSGIIDSNTGSYVSNSPMDNVWSIKPLGIGNQYYTVGQYLSLGFTQYPNTALIVDYSDPCNVVQVHSFNDINNGQSEIINYNSFMLVAAPTLDKYLMYSLAVTGNTSEIFNTKPELSYYLRNPLIQDPLASFVVVMTSPSVTLNGQILRVYDSTGAIFSFVALIYKISQIASSSISTIELFKNNVWIRLSLYETFSQSDVDNGLVRISILSPKNYALVNENIYLTVSNGLGSSLNIKLTIQSSSSDSSKVKNSQTALFNIQSAGLSLPIFIGILVGVFLLVGCIVAYLTLKKKQSRSQKPKPFSPAVINPKQSVNKLSMLPLKRDIANAGSPAKNSSSSLPVLTKEANNSVTKTSYGNTTIVVESDQIMTIPAYLKVLPGSYTLGRSIARGGFGEIFFISYPPGSDLALRAKGRQLLAKRISSSSTKNSQFMQELSMMNLFNGHKNFVSIYGYDDIQQIIITEYYAAGSLHSWMPKIQSLKLHTLIIIIHGTATAVKEMHERGLVHNDLKTANILIKISKSGTPCAILTDFGLANIVDNTVMKVGEFIIANTQGTTACYCAPDRLIARFPKVTPAQAKMADVFSFGMIIYAILTRREPWS